MFTVIGIMFGGIAVGYLLRKVELLQKIGKPISYTILLLVVPAGYFGGGQRCYCKQPDNIRRTGFPDRPSRNDRKCFSRLGSLSFLF